MRTTDASRTTQQGLVFLPPLLFVLLGSAFFWKVRGDDLASSFVGCRVIATGQAFALYSHDPVNFAAIADDDPVWFRLAREGGFQGWLHPYVQTPLWGWILKPVCTHLQWPGFLHLFVILSLCAIAAIVYLTARFWAPRFCTPSGLTLIFVLLSLSEPFLFAMVLVQTHALILLLAIVGMLLAQRDRPLLAGLLVACAAAVKITPGVLFLYWLANRRWRAATSLVVWSVVLLGFTRLVSGAVLFHAFLDSMHRISHVLLVAENNQSLAAWYMGRFFSPDEVFDVNAYPLPVGLRLLSTSLMGAFALLGGWMDSRSESGSAGQRRLPAFGVCVTLLAMTLFAPIAWSHYFIILTIPLMLLAESARQARGTWSAFLWICVVTATLLLYRPLAPDVIRTELSDYAVLRGEFYAGVLCLAGTLLAWRLSLKNEQPGQPIGSTGR